MLGLIFFGRHRTTSLHKMVSMLVLVEAMTSLVEYRDMVTIMIKSHVSLWPFAIEGPHLKARVVGHKPKHLHESLFFQMTQLTYQFISYLPSTSATCITNLVDMGDAKKHRITSPRDLGCPDDAVTVNLTHYYSIVICLSIQPMAIVGMCVRWFYSRTVSIGVVSGYIHALFIVVRGWLQL